MPDVVCNTSPLQYLHPLGRLDLLPALVRRILVPPAVVEELRAGRAAGVDVPHVEQLGWIEVSPPRESLTLPQGADLGRGETEVLALGLEVAGSLVILDDGVARRAADALGIRRTRTLGLLLDAKRVGLIPAVAPLLDELQALRFRVSPATRHAILKLAGEVLG